MTIDLHQVDAPETAYNERVVLFLRQPNILDVLKEKTGSCQKSIRDKVNAIRQDGTLALDRLSCDVELTMLLRFDVLVIDTAFEGQGDRMIWTIKCPIFSKVPKMATNLVFAKGFYLFKCLWQPKLAPLPPTKLKT